MVLVDITWNDGTKVRLDIPQAAIDFYEKQGVTVIRVDTLPQVCAKGFHLESHPDFSNGICVKDATSAPLSIKVRVDTSGTDLVNGTLKLLGRVSQFSSIPDTAGIIRARAEVRTADQQLIRRQDLSFNPHNVDILPFQIPVGSNKLVRGNIHIVDSNGIPISNFALFEVQEGSAPPPTEPPTPTPTPTLGNFDKLVMGALIAGAILPLSRSKKK